MTMTWQKRLMWSISECHFASIDCVIKINYEMLVLVCLLFNRGQGTGRWWQLCIMWSFSVSSCFPQSGPESVGSSSLRLPEWCPGYLCGVRSLCCTQSTHDHRGQAVELGYVTWCIQVQTVLTKIKIHMAQQHPPQTFIESADLFAAILRGWHGRARCLFLYLAHIFTFPKN